MDATLMTLVQEISIGKNKKIEGLCKKIIKKMSFKSAHDLENLSNLCYNLYIYGYTNDLYRLFPTISLLSFSGNWDLWTWGELMQALVFYVLSDSDQTQQDAQIALEKLMFDKRDQDVILRRCNGSRLEEKDKEIKRAMLVGDKKEACYWLQSKLEELIVIYAMGGSEKYPLPDIRLQVDNIKKEILANS